MTPLGAAQPAAAAAVADGHTRDSLFEGFVEPPATVRPFVRWWWNGDKLSADEIRRELDVMKAAGIGGVEINSIKFPAERDPLNITALDWLSPAWCAMVRTATEGARERGLTADIIVGSGWPFGGRFLPREHQTKILSVGRRKVTGPSTVSLSEQEMFDGVDLTLHSKNDRIFQTVKFARLTPAALDRFSPGTDVTGRLQGGRLTVDVPAGEYFLHYFVVQEGFQAVINGAPGSDGSVLNHFSRAATDFYLSHMSEGMKPHLGNLRDHFRAFFCDSLELEGANWTEDLLEEFNRRRSYDLLPWLPYLLQKTGRMGDAVESADTVRAGPELEDQIQRVRHDYWTTLIELFRERFLEPYIQWCRQQGVQSRVQAYGHGYDPLESSMLVDIPECETWLNMHTGSPRSNGAQSINNKFTASGARLAGKRLVSCEEITNTSNVFFTPLELVKIAGDESNLSGVTHSILHGFNYSPPAAGFPGWVRYGTYFSEQNPWWPFMRRWTDYKARLSWLLQQAEPQANIAILHPLADLWKQWGMQRDPYPKKVLPEYAHRLWQALHRNGHNCDYTSENILCRSKMQDGAAVFNSRRYDTLLLMGVDTMRPDTARALANFARGGGRIVFIGRTPSVAPGLMARGVQDQEVRATMQRLVADHPATCRIVAAPAKDEDLLAWFQRVREQCGLVPDVAFASASPHVSQTFHRMGDRDVFFLVNSSREQPATVRARFRTAGRTPWLWDAETGTRRLLPWDEAPNALTLRLEPAASRLIVFEKAAAAAPVRESVPSDAGAQAVTGSWKVELTHLDGSRREVSLDTLRNLGQLEGLAGFAGRAVYRVRFSAPAAEGHRYLDLGVVREISEVTLNGRALGAHWYGRHLYELPATLRSDGNELEIRVTTVAGNYAKSLTSNETAQRWTKALPARPMGLLGPVRLLRAQ
ncbi:MAG: glycosyl hydrolase [Opitutaceae bacterium]|nr:glycosyl hydrolase [Opitutaceae bacterium]